MQETPPLGQWLSHQNDIVRIDHWPVWRHAAFEPIDDPDIDPDKHPPLTRIACDDEGQHWIVPDLEDLASAARAGEIELVESGTDPWPDAREESAAWVEVNDHGNASAWVGVGLSRMAQGERAAQRTFPPLALRFAHRLRTREPAHRCPAQGLRTHWRAWSGAERKIASMRQLCARVGCAAVNDAALAREDLEEAGASRAARAQMVDAWWDEYEGRIRQSVHPQAGLAVEGNWLVLALGRTDGGALETREPGGPIPAQRIWIEIIEGEPTRVERIDAATLAWEAV